MGNDICYNKTPIRNDIKTTVIGASDIEAHAKKITSTFNKPGRTMGNTRTHNIQICLVGLDTNGIESLQYKVNKQNHKFTP